MIEPLSYEAKTGVFLLRIPFRSDRILDARCYQITGRFADGTVYVLPLLPPKERPPK